MAAIALSKTFTGVPCSLSSQFICRPVEIPSLCRFIRNSPQKRVSGIPQRAWAKSLDKPGASYRRYEQGGHTFLVTARKDIRQSQGSHFSRSFYQRLRSRPRQEESLHNDYRGDGQTLEYQSRKSCQSDNGLQTVIKSDCRYLHSVPSTSSLGRLLCRRVRLLNFQSKPCPRIGPAPALCSRQCRRKAQSGEKIDVHPP